MTDEQREQARRAQAAYVAWLREWENFIRNREAYRQRENHVTENGDGEITSICPFTNADIEKAVTICGDFLQAENEAYQTFSKFFIGKPDVLKGFDELRDTVRKAYALSDQGLVPDKLADALKNLAEAVEVFDFCANSQEELVQAIAQAQSTLSEQLSKQRETIGKIESGQARLNGEVGKLRREIKGESTPGTNGGRPSCDHGDRQKLAVIKYAKSKRRDHASDYARHVFDSWKGAGGYGTADSLRKATQRFLTDNGLPTLPTTETEHWDFVKAVENNAVITAKLEKLE